MPFPRMTTRRWMIAVAVVAVLIGACVETAKLAAISAERRRLARFYAQSAASQHALADMGEQSARNLLQRAEEHRAASHSDSSFLESAARTVQTQTERAREIAAFTERKSVK